MSPPVRVLVDAIHARSGGGVSQLRNLLAHLAADDKFEIHLVIHGEQQELLGPLDPRVRRHSVHFRNGFLRRLIWEQICLPIMARRNNADVTYAMANYGPLFAPGLVITLTNALAVGRQERRLGKRVYWWALAAMTFVSLLACRRAVSVSEYASQWIRFWPNLHRKVAVIPPGIDPFFAELAAKPEPSTMAPFLLAVGDFYIQKNYGALVAAFSLLAPRFPDLELRIAGAPIDPACAVMVSETVARAGLGSRVQLIGRQDREALRRLYGQCAAFVFPSTIESFGIPLAEAMAAGAPIVSSRTSAMPEVAGEAAEYFNPGNVTDMADAIERVLTDAALRERLKTAGRTRAARFDRSKVATEIAAVFMQAAGR